jgi:hypothetical protein
MASKHKAKMVVRHPSDVPTTFASEAEEQAFWDNAEFTDEFLDRAEPVPEGVLPPRPRTRPIAVRFDDDTIARLKAVAARKGKGYQSLLKEFVSERLYEEEKREGIIPEPGQRR